MKSYICHYPKLKERLSYLMPALGMNGILDVSVVHGIDRNDIGPNEQVGFSNDRNLVKDRLNYTICPYNYDILSDSEKPVLANFLTHIEIWEKIVDSKEEYALVLEDDARILDDFQTNWQILLETFPLNLDIAYLHEGCGMTVEKNIGIKPEVNKILYECHRRESRTCCSYIVSKKFCERILSDLYPIALGVDHELNYIQKKHNANVYWASPPLFSEGSTYEYKSSIR